MGIVLKGNQMGDCGCWFKPSARLSCGQFYCSPCTLNTLKSWIGGFHLNDFMLPRRPSVMIFSGVCPPPHSTSSESTSCEQVSWLNGFSNNPLTRTPIGGPSRTNTRVHLLLLMFESINPKKKITIKLYSYATFRAAQRYKVPSHGRPQIRTGANPK